MVDLEYIQKALNGAGIREIPENAPARLLTYLDLLLRWNARFNLSAIRDPEEIVCRHFAESAYAAQLLPANIETLLDYGSGAGFPGIPIAICRPEIRVTLAESQGKKVSFLREAVRITRANCEVFGGRVETLAPASLFDGVTMRAVEKMESAIPLAAAHAAKYLVLLATEQSAPSFRGACPDLLWEDFRGFPNSHQMVLLLGARPPQQ